VVAGLVDCAHGLALEVVAEGVEDREQSSRLDGLDVAWQQGFLFSEPLALGDATRWLQHPAGASLSAAG